MINLRISFSHLHVQPPPLLKKKTKKKVAVWTGGWGHFLRARFIRIQSVTTEGKFTQNIRRRKNRDKEVKPLHGTSMEQRKSFQNHWDGRGGRTRLCVRSSGLCSQLFEMMSDSKPDQSDTV